MSETVDIPFNKDQATVSLLKDTCETLEMCFNLFERGADEERVGYFMRQVFERWQKKHPKGGER